MKNTFALHSFGCRVNQAEIEVINRQFMNQGFVQDLTHPHLYIINTCAVTSKAEREARQLINQVRTKFPDTNIVVTGCAATNWLKTGYQPQNIDYLIDNTNKEYLVDILLKKLDIKSPTSSIDTVPKLDKYESSGRTIIKIQDGCHRFCTFCIVPYLRGRPKSYSISAITKEVKNLPESTKEIILTAINTEAYGRDTKESFVTLLKMILTHTRIPRISFGSIHPWSINDEFMEFYKHTSFRNRLVNYFHIPLQSGSNKILQLMKRGYTKEEIDDTLKQLNALRPLTHIGTDIIVGFLDENDHDFEETYEFLKQSPISRFHVFRFSNRTHTAAYYMAKRLKEVSAGVKIKRSHILLKLSKTKYEVFLRKHVDRKMSGLVLATKKGKYYQMLLDNQVPVLVNQAGLRPGELHEVRIEKYKMGTLFGTIS